MVRRGVMLSLREASCWSVEVMKGGAGLRFFSDFLTLLTPKDCPFSSESTCSTSSALCSSRFFGSP